MSVDYKAMTKTKRVDYFYKMLLVEFKKIKPTKTLVDGYEIDQYIMDEGQYDVLKVKLLRVGSEIRR